MVWPLVAPSHLRLLAEPATDLWQCLELVPCWLTWHLLPEASGRILGAMHMCC
jgi:hypothetical protein